MPRVKPTIKAKVAEGKQPKTWKKYEGTLSDFVLFCGENSVKHVDQVTLTLIDDYRLRRAATLVPIGQTQLYHDISLLKRFFAWCAERQMAMVNPLANQRYSRPTQRRRSVVPNLEKVNAILAALPARIVEPVAALAFGGMRNSNCRNL